MVKQMFKVTLLVSGEAELENQLVYSKAYLRNLLTQLSNPEQKLSLKIQVNRLCLKTCKSEEFPKYAGFLKRRSPANKTGGLCPN